MSQIKQILGLVGLVVALAGIALESPVVVWAAIALLGAATVIRAILAIRARRAERKTEESGG